MKDSDELIKAIHTFQLAVVVGSLTIIAVCTLFGFIMLVSVPDTIRETVYAAALKADRQAIDDKFTNIKPQ